MVMDLTKGAKPIVVSEYEGETKCGTFTVDQDAILARLKGEDVKDEWDITLKPSDYRIMDLLDEGLNKTQIAKKLKVGRQTVSKRSNTGAFRAEHKVQKAKRERQFIEALKEKTLENADKLTLDEKLSATEEKLRLMALNSTDARVRKDCLFMYHTIIMKRKESERDHESGTKLVITVEKAREVADVAEKSNMVVGLSKEDRTRRDRQAGILEESND